MLYKLRFSKEIPYSNASNNIIFIRGVQTLISPMPAECESSLKQQLRTNGGGVIPSLVPGLCFPHSPSWQGSAITAVWCGCCQVRWAISYGPAPTGQMSSLQPTSTATSLADSISSWASGQDTLRCLFFSLKWPEPFPSHPLTVTACRPSGTLQPGVSNWHLLKCYVHVNK